MLPVAEAFTAQPSRLTKAPSESHRFKGLRFQITFVYLLFFDDVRTWEHPRFDQEYPFRREKHLCDIVHAPGKSGTDVMKLIDLQITRKGLSRPELVAGVGDGGGENEGCQGVHALIQATNPSYCRRRCLSHISWRVADAGLSETQNQGRTLLSINVSLSETARRGPVYKRSQVSLSIRVAWVSSWKALPLG